MKRTCKIISCVFASVLLVSVIISCCIPFFKAKAFELSGLPDDFDLDYYRTKTTLSSGYDKGELYNQFCESLLMSPCVIFYNSFQENTDFLTAVKSWEEVRCLANPSNAIDKLNLLQRYESSVYTVLSKTLYGEDLSDLTYSNAFAESISFVDDTIKYYRNLGLELTDINLSSPEEVARLKDTALAFVTNGKDAKWATLEEYTDLVQPYSQMINEIFAIGGGVLKIADNIGMYCALMDMGSSAVEFLNIMYNSTSDVLLKTAIDNVRKSIGTDWCGIVSKGIYDVGFSLTKTAAKKVVDFAWQGFCEMSPFLKGMSIGEKVGTAACNVLFATQESISQYEYLKILAILSEASYNAMNKVKSSCVNSLSSKSASVFQFALDFNMVLYEIGSNVSVETASIFCVEGLYNKFINLFTNKKEQTLSQFESSVFELNEYAAKSYSGVKNVWLSYLKTDYPELYEKLTQNACGQKPIEKIEVCSDKYQIRVGETTARIWFSTEPRKNTGRVGLKSDNEAVIPSSEPFDGTYRLTEANMGTANVTIYSIEDPTINAKVQVEVVESVKEIQFADFDYVTGTCGYDVTWRYNKRIGRLIISGTGNMSDSQPWYAYKDSIYSVIIEDGVTSIGDEAFDYHTNLLTVSIPKSVEVIGERAFRKCINLNKIKIPNSSTVIGEDAFLDSAFYKNSWNWTGDVLYLDSFLLCAKDSSESSYVVKDGTTVISNSAFEDWTELSRIELPESLLVIGADAFGNSKIESVTIPKNVIKCYSAFGRNPVLKTVNFNATNCTSCSAFCGIETITDVNIGNKVEYLPYALFEKCTGITEVYIPGSVAGMGNRVFYGCTGLESLVIGNGVTSLGEHEPFSDCTKLKKIVLPDTLTAIADYSFDGCSSLTEITIPAGVEKIGSHAFNDCKNLKTVNFNATACSEMFYTFNGCDNLTVLNIGQNVISIPSMAFVCPKLSTVTIPEGIVSIGEGAFACPELKTVYYNAVNCENFGNIRPTSIGGVFSPSVENVIIGDSVQCIPPFAFVGNENMETITIPENILSIGAHAFDDCESLKTVNYNATNATVKYPFVDKNYDIVFLNCPSLTTFNIGENVRSVPREELFETNNSFETLNFSATEFQDSILWFSSAKLNTINISSNVTRLPTFSSSTMKTLNYNARDAVKNNENYNIIFAAPEMETVNIGPDVEKLPDLAFSSCESLKTVNFEQNKGKLKSIGNYCFMACDSLTCFIIPDGVTEIGEGSFASCDNMRFMHIPKTVENIEFYYNYNTDFYFCSQTSDCYASDYANLNKIAFRKCDGTHVIPELPDDIGSLDVPAKDVVKQPTETTISYGDAIVLHVNASDVPQGGRVEWTVSNGNFDFKVSSDGMTCEITPTSSGDTTFTATVYDADGNVISTDEQEMTSKAGFFQKIIAFFKKLFGLTKTIPEVYKDII